MEISALWCTPNLGLPIIETWRMKHEGIKGNKN